MTTAGSDGVVLTADRGNTHLDLLAHGPPPRRLRVRPDRIDEIAAFVVRAAPDVVVASSVVAGALDALAATLAGRAVPLLVAGRDLLCPLALDYPEPATLGTDRWLAALAAWNLVGDAVVVDCGSAVTVDIVAAATFRGGAIAPGLWALADGLAGAAPALPRFAADRRAPPRMPATTTADCVDLGVLLTHAGGVDRLVAEAREQVPNATVVVTGGGADAYLAASRQPGRLVDDLVHRGLRCLLNAASGPS